jgi:hypothetical protein
MKPQIALKIPWYLPPPMPWQLKHYSNGTKPNCILKLEWLLECLKNSKFTKSWSLLIALLFLFH